MENQFIKPFDPHDDNVQQSWNRWVDRFSLFLKVKKITVAEEQLIFMDQYLAVNT